MPQGKGLPHCAARCEKVALPSNCAVGHEDGGCCGLCCWRVANALPDAGLTWTYCLRPCVLSACSDEKCEQCAKWGASNVINYKTEDYAEVVNSRTQVCPFTHSAGVPC